MLRGAVGRFFEECECQYSLRPTVIYYENPANETHMECIGCLHKLASKQWELSNPIPLIFNS